MTSDSRERASEPLLTEEQEAFATALMGIRDRELQGFAPPSGPFDESGHSPERVFASSAVSMVDTIELILELVRARRQHGFDRVAWIREFEFRGTPCQLRWTNSGLRLRVMDDGDPSAGDGLIGAEVERRLTSAARSLYVKALSPIVERELSENRATVVNQFVRYRGAVDFHLDHLRYEREKHAASARAGGDDSADDTIQRAARGFIDGHRHRMRLAFICTAALAAYFSYVQHALVILTAFSPEALRPAFSLRKLLRAKWAEQFDAAFPPPHDSRAARAKGDLTHLAREYRGRLLHGGAGHASDGVMVEWAPGRRAMVSEDGKPNGQFMLWQAPLREEEIDDILARIGRVDAMIDHHPYAAWLKSGLQADFRTDAVEHALRMNTEGHVDNYIRYSEEKFTDALNWD